MGTYYMFLHNLIAMTGLYLLLFSNKIWHLLILMNFIIMDSMSIVFIHNCPLTMLENKYLGTSLVKKRQKFFKDINIVYQCEHEYENQFEVLINIWGFACMKIFYLLIFGPHTL
jgi:hypothetical protein